MRDPTFSRVQIAPYEGPRAAQTWLNVKRSGGGRRKRTKAMKTILSALVALSVLAAVAPAGAAEFDAKKFWQEQGTRY
jgi:hypothetical protein